ncbi:hypothetical protein F52700_12186 [Fusarium sp. NRRL 52700]|nr:hypothetical protein F52700_12186 [Fusarium sp. NRRL 52700]
MPSVPEISFSAVGQLGFWKSALEELKDTYPPLRNDAPLRPLTYLPPPLPVKEQMDEIYRFPIAVERSIAFLRNNATSAEDLMVLRVIAWLNRAQRDETARIQGAIWRHDPQRFQRELRDGHWHLVNGDAVQGPAPGANAAGNAGGN